MRLKKISFLFCFLLITSFVFAKDFYVKSGAKRGKGTQKRPYKGIYKALRKASSGDVIHVASGRYHGKLKAGYLIIKGRGITLLGGYSDDFSERNPWKYRTIIEASPKTKARTFDMGLIKVEKDHTGTIIDGFILDAGTRNKYNRDGSLDVEHSRKNPVVSFSSPDCHIRNCVIMNTAFIGSRVTGKNSSIVNSLFVNNNQYALDIYGTKQDSDFTVKNCTFVKTWKFYSGDAINIGSNCSIKMEKNIFAFNGEHGVASKRNSSGHQMLENVFYKNANGLYIFFNAENKGTLVISDADDLEDANLAEASDNFVADPEFKLVKAEKKKEPKKETPKKKASDDPFASEEKKDDPFASSEEKKDDPFGGKKSNKPKNKSAFAPRMSIDEALSYLHVGNSEVKEIGAQLTGPFPTPKSKKKSVPKLNYTKIEFNELFKAGNAYKGKAVKFKAALIDLMRYVPNYVRVKDISPKTNTFLRLRHPKKMRTGRDVIGGYVAKGSSAELQLKKAGAVGRWRKPGRRNVFWVSGVVFPLKKMHKNGIGIIVYEVSKR